MPEAPLPIERRPARVTPPETPGLSGLLTLAVGVVVVAGLYLGRTVLIPITLAVLLSFLLAPLVNLLRWAHVPRIPAALLSVLLALVIILSLAGLIGTQVAQLAQEVPRYTTTIQTKVETLQGFLTSRMHELMNGLAREMHGGGAKPEAPPQQTQQAGGEKPIPVEVHQPNLTAIELAERLIAPIVDPLATTAIVFIVAIFVLLQREDLRDRLIRVFGSSDLHRTTVAMNDAARRLSRYFLSQLAINATFGVIIGFGLFLIGIPSPVLWGVVAALLRFVPYIGAPLAAIAPLVLAAGVDPGWSKMIWTAALYAVVEPIMGQAVEPLLYGHSTGLSPFSVVVAATFWTWLWGPIGLILSTPLTLCLVVLGRHVERLEFLDVLLGDRPALTPVESFYQRMLAGDPDEARDQAELLLRERSLSSYYDEVALKGLQLAAVDAGRGVLTASQMERMREATRDLIEELGEYEDADPAGEEGEEEPAGPSRAEQDLPKQPAPGASIDSRAGLPPAWQGPAPVLCIAGRGPLDEAAALMLAQLLQKHGIGARVLPHEAVSRANVPLLDREGVAMACISYLELAGSTSHLRYLLRRLRRHMPGVNMLVGLWPAESDVLLDDRLRTAIGADYYVASLHEAVDACLDAAHRESRAAGTAEPAGLPAA
jgi:predicted PurR-regulated permease PerM